MLMPILPSPPYLDLRPVVPTLAPALDSLEHYDKAVGPNKTSWAVEAEVVSQFVRSSRR
ncbi:hypothetical protein BDV93DRAFT_517079 [Ceratobasidium sp. AG-I]|nr:hypothetical protein BDV93DRAFT_517079 [Ceratobasidium sp. AG-I]